jgi:hypothetical protein
MPMAWFDSYGFVLRERALAAFLVLANDRLVGGEIPQLPYFRDGDRGFVPRVFLALDVHEKLLASVRAIVSFRHGSAVALLVFDRVHSCSAKLRRHAAFCREVSRATQRN